MTAISMQLETFWLWDSQLLPVERWSDLDGRKLAQARLREAGKPTREGGRPLGLPMGRMSIVYLGFLQLATVIGIHHLPFSENVQASNTCFTVTVAGAASAPKGELDFGACRARIDI